MVVDKNRSEGQSLGKVCDSNPCDLSRATKDSVNCYEIKAGDPKPVDFARLLTNPACQRSKFVKVQLFM